MGLIRGEVTEKEEDRFDQYIICKYKLINQKVERDKNQGTELFSYFLDLM